MIGDDSRLQVDIARHSLAWLFAGSLVGMLLSTLLLMPRLGDLLVPLTYGRWVPVHLDIMLYGWCSLPLVGLLYRLYLLRPADRRRGRWALAAWSGSLLFGSVSWLYGGSSGKLFLEWSGPARAGLVAAMAVLAAVLAVGWVRSRKSLKAGGAALRWRASGALLFTLVLIPAILWLATNPRVYPPYNPDSGGSTGGSLLGSSLVVVGLFLLTPVAMGLAPRRGWRRELPIVGLLGLHFAWFLALDHGNRSHHEWFEVVSLASLAIWPPLLIGFFRRFHWPPGSRRWLLSLAAWGTLLVGTGIPMFLPGILERFKFTHVMVAHAHLAMACMSSSYLFLVLLGLLRRTELAGLLGEAAPFRLWHLGSALHLVSLVALGLVEAADPGAVFQGDAVVLGLLALRVVAGGTILAAAWCWLSGAFAPRRRAVAAENRSPGLAAAEAA